MRLQDKEVQERLWEEQHEYEEACQRYEEEIGQWRRQHKIRVWCLHPQQDTCKDL